MSAKFTNGLSDEYLKPEDKSVMESNFESGMMQQQNTQRGSKMDGERTSVMQGAGLSQPVADGTKPYKRPE